MLPGGLVRLAPRGKLIAAMQRGGSSADCWVMTDGQVDHTSLLQSAPSTLALAHQDRPVTSRAAENLFWLGRYTERAENSIAPGPIVLEHLDGEERGSPALMNWLSAMAEENALVLPDVPTAAQSPRVFARSLMAGLSTPPDAETPVVQRGLQPRALQGHRRAGARAAVARPLEPDRARRIRLCHATAQRLSTDAESASTDALDALQNASDLLAAITGSQTDRMVRDNGWRLLSIGRHIERLTTSRARSRTRHGARLPARNRRL